jgi:hypothetical protein
MRFPFPSQSEAIRPNMAGSRPGMQPPGFGRSAFRSGTFILVLYLPLALCVTQLVMGADTLASVLFSVCVSLCFLATSLAGGLRSFLGLLVLVWGAKLFVLALIVKIFVGESTSSSLDAPVETALVYTLGFAAITLAVVVQRFLPVPKPLGLLPPLEARHFLAITVLFFISSFIAPLLAGDRVTNIALILALGGFRDFSIVCAMHWAFLRGYSRPHLHPLVLGLLACCFLLGLSSTSKQAVLTPIMLYYISLIALTGFRHKSAFVPLVPAVLLFQFVFGPVADTMKSQTTDLRGMALVRAMWNANWEALRNPEISRQTASLSRTEYERRGDYYFQTNVGYLERFALLKTGDKLISSTVVQGQTGWEVILWDLSMVPPRFVYPNKPVQGPSSQLARFAGLLSADDYTTSVSFGIFPELFHAQGYAAVLLIGFASVTLIFWWYRCFVGDHPGLTFYGLVLIGMVHHTIAEDLLGSFINLYYRPLVLMLAMLPAFFLVRSTTGRNAAGPAVRFRK